jgi:hypothetical protein
MEHIKIDYNICNQFGKTRDYILTGVTTYKRGKTVVIKKSLRINLLPSNKCIITIQIQIWYMFRRFSGNKIK